MSRPNGIYILKKDKLSIEELQSLYSSSSIIRMIKSVRTEYRIVVGNAEGNRPLERTRYRWGDDIKEDIGDIGRRVMD
jgi:hypothetical protein